MDRFPEQSWDPLDERVPSWLASATVTDGARIPYASNYVFLLELQHDDAPILGYAVYKPGQGRESAVGLSAQPVSARGGGVSVVGGAWLEPDSSDD